MAPFKMLNPKGACITFLGESGSYSHSAALHFVEHFRDLVGHAPTFLGAANFHNLVKKIIKHDADFGILPVENSIAGTVHGVYPLLAQTKLKIVAELIETIDHVLVCPRPCEPEQITLTDIQKVYGHPQAIQQCVDFLEKNLSLAEWVEVSSTTEAAKCISSLTEKQSHSLAIINKQTAHKFHLPIVRQNIQNKEANHTRMWIISNQSFQEFVESARTTSSHPYKNTELKTSCIFDLPHASGSLSRVLQIFAEYDISLSKIESVPRQDASKAFEYSFFCDLEGSAHQNPMKEAIEKIIPLAERFTLLGIYPKIGAYPTKAQ